MPDRAVVEVSVLAIGVCRVEGYDRLASLAVAGVLTPKGAAQPAVVAPNSTACWADYQKDIDVQQVGVRPILCQTASAAI